MSIDRLHAWHDLLQEKIAYFRRRKTWARQVKQDHKLTSPGDEAKGEFEGDNYKVKIGPRMGLRVYGVLPWQKVGVIWPKPVENRHQVATHRPQSTLTWPLTKGTFRVRVEA